MTPKGVTALLEYLDLSGNPLVFCYFQTTKRVNLSTNQFHPIGCCSLSCDGWTDLVWKVSHHISFTICKQLASYCEH